MHTSMHYIKVHAYTMLGTGHAIKVTLQRTPCTHAPCDAARLCVYGEYAGTVHCTVDALLVHEYAWGGAPPSCI